MIDITPEMELMYQYGNYAELEYLDLMEHILKNGEDKEDRTGVGTRSIFHSTLSFDLGEYIPVFTSKKIAWKSIVSELLWFLEGSQDERRLAEIHYGKPREELVGKRTIWTDNAEKQGKEKGYESGILDDFDEGRTTSFKGLSAGFSVELPLSDETNFGLDYSYRPADPLQSVHTFGARIVL